MRGKTLKGRNCIAIFAILWILIVFSGELGCRSQTDILQPENFKYIEGTFVQRIRKVLVVKTDEGEQMKFRVGMRTVFVPDRWPIIGERLRIRYHTKVLSHEAIGNYFIGYEVINVEHTADFPHKTAIVSSAVSEEKPKTPESGKVPTPPLSAPSLQESRTFQHWAVIIGVSEYQDSHIPTLRYAAADAQSFYNWLASPDGGRYPPSRIKLLVNEQATASTIKEALYVWLKQVTEDAMVIIFFVGHGSPGSPESPDNLFLLPYETQYDTIATTAFPILDIETAVKNFIRAKRVLVIADACHADGFGHGFDVTRRASRAIKHNPISSGLQNLSEIGEGVVVISASDDGQFSQESKKWGGGHGVFTYFLLKGLKGKADYIKDKRVTLGELIPYLSDQVRKATTNAQSPTVAGKFDPALSIER
jgi:uncharacterized caspase-like protein